MSSDCSFARCLGASIQKTKSSAHSQHLKFSMDSDIINVDKFITAVTLKSDEREEKNVYI